MSVDQEAFLAGLKPGDKVVLRNRKLDTWGRRHGPTIYTVARIPPKRSKMVLVDPKGVELEVKGGWNGMARIEPYTDEVLVEIKRDSAVLTAKARAYRIHDQLRTFDQKALDLSPDQIARFLEHTKMLAVFLDAFDPVKPL